MFLTQTNKEPQDILLTSEFRPKAYFLIQTTAQRVKNFSEERNQSLIN